MLQTDFIFGAIAELERPGLEMETTLLVLRTAVVLLYERAEQGDRRADAALATMAQAAAVLVLEMDNRNSPPQCRPISPGFLLL